MNDDDAVRAQLARTLEDHHHRVSCVSGARAARQRLAEQPFDLLLSSISLAGHVDFELLRALRSAGCWDLPIVLLSGDLPSEERVRGLTMGADDVIGRELDPLELVARIRALLRRSVRQQQLARDNLLDPLTMLLNRRGLRDAYEREQARIRRRGGSLALLVLDLDDFKQINDQHGHAAGDAVLCGVSRVLEQGVRGSDRVIRLGGDEFAVLMPDADERAAAVLAARIRSLSPVQVALPGVYPVEVYFCSGIASGDFNDPLDQLLQRADARMYGAKLEAAATPMREQH